MKKPRRPGTALEIVDLEGEDSIGQEKSHESNEKLRPKSSARSRDSRVPSATTLGDHGSPGRPKSSRVGSRPTSTKSSPHTPGHPRPQSRLSLTSTRRTVTRSGKRTRPATTTCATEEPGSFLGQCLDSDSDSEEPRTSLPSTEDIGGIDISMENGWDTDLEVEESKEEFDHTGKSVYVETCKRNGVIPASYFLRHMHDSQLEMRHHGLGPQGVKPLCVSLVSNARILRLDLTDNWLGFEGGLKICDMLKENCFITELNLSDNRLSLRFAEAFKEVLAANTTLSHIILAGNDLDDLAAVHLAEAMMNTTKVECLNLSNNKFGEKAGIVFGPAIAENSSIKHLDLSWNCIRRRGAIEIAKGLKQNILMAKLNLSWNGFGNDGAKALGDALKVNSTLEELDISNNRISPEGAVLFGKGLTANESLKVLKMGKNPMQSAGCYAICASITRSQSCILERIDFSDILVNNDFYDKLKQVHEQLPNLHLRHGGDGVPIKPKARVHPMIKLKNYIAKHNLKLVDFFNRVDKDGSMSVTREEFAKGIEDVGIKLTREEISLLLDELDKDGDGEINYSELVIGHQDFTEKERRLANTISSMKQ